MPETVFDHRNCRNESTVVSDVNPDKIVIPNANSDPAFWKSFESWARNASKRNLLIFAYHAHAGSGSLSYLENSFTAASSCGVKRVRTHS